MEDRTRKNLSPSARISDQRAGSIVGSQFGDGNHFFLGSLNMHLSPEQKLPFVSTAEHYPHRTEDFISNLLTYDPRDRRDYYERPSRRQKTGCFTSMSDNKWWLENAFDDYVSDGSILHTWLKSKSSQFLWIEDETRAGHSLLVRRLLDKAEESTQLHDHIITYAFCDKRPDGTEEPNQFSVENVLAELIHNLLTTDNSMREFILPQIQNLYGNRIKRRETQNSRFTVFEKVIRHILQLSGHQKEFIFVTDALDCFPADSLANGIPLFVLFMDSLAMEFPNLKWAFSTGTGSRITQLIQDLNTSVHKLIIKPEDVAEAFDLGQEIRQVEDFGAALHAFNLQGQKQMGSDSCDFSWFHQCISTRLWWESQPLTWSQDSRLLWYRKPVLDSTPSALGFHVANYRPEVKEPALVAVHFCLSSFWSDGFCNMGVGGNEEEILHPSRVLWALFVLLVTARYDATSSTITNIMSLSHPLREDLRKLRTRMNLSSESSGHAGSTVDENNPTPGATIHQLHRRTQRFGDDELKCLGRLIGSLLRNAAAKKNEVILVLNSLEIGKVQDNERFLAFLGKLGFGTRILLCSSALCPKSCDCPKPSCKFSRRWVDESTEYRECLETLRFKGMHQRRSEIATVSEHANRWLWGAKEYQVWEKEGGILWVSGKPGSGKSVLARMIQQNFERRHGGRLNGKSTSTCDWFYTSQGSAEGRQHSAMLRTVISGMLAGSEDIFRLIREEYRDLVKASAGTPIWHAAHLMSLFEKICRWRDTPNTLIVLDGLDESQEDSESELKRSSVLRMFRRMSSLPSSPIRCILLSRPNPDIEQGLKTSHRIVMQHHNHDDISALVEAGIIKLRASVSFDSANHLDTHCQGLLTAPIEKSFAKVEKYLNDNASGVILWVALVLQELQRAIEDDFGFTLNDIDATLSHLPLELEHLYSYSQSRQILSFRNSKRCLHTARSLWMWILGSQRWASLTLGQLWEAMAVTPRQKNRLSELTIIVAPEAISDNGLYIAGDWDKFRRIVHQYCGMLVEISPTQDHGRTHGESKLSGVTLSSWIVRLAHQTVSNFFQNPENCRDLDFDIEYAQRLVLATSYSYLGISLPSGSTENSPHGKASMDPLVKDLSMAIWRVSGGVSLELLATKDHFKVRPLSQIAIQVVGCQSEEPILKVFETLNHGDLSSEHLFLPHWLADLCFVPSTSATDIQPLILKYCLRGEIEIMSYLVRLLRKYQPQYYDIVPRRGLQYSRYHQILGGASEAFSFMCPELFPCLRPVAADLSREPSFYDLQQQKVKGKALEQGLANMGSVISLQEGPDHTCGRLCPSITMKFSGGKTEQVKGAKIISALREVVELLKLFPKPPLSSHGFPLDPWFGA